MNYVDIGKLRSTCEVDGLRPYAISRWNLLK